MKGYLRSGAVRRLLGITQSRIDYYCRKGYVEPVKEKENGRSFRNFTFDHVRKMAILKYGDIAAKEFVIKCPYCDKLMKVSLIYLIYKQWESNGS